MVLWAESSLHSFPKPPVFHLVKPPFCKPVYAVVPLCIVYSLKDCERYILHLKYNGCMAPEKCCEYSVTSDLCTSALLKEEFVWEHLGKTYHRVGCSCLDFCLHDSLSTKDGVKGGLPSARCHSSKDSIC